MLPLSGLSHLNAGNSQCGLSIVVMKYPSAILKIKNILDLNDCQTKNSGSKIFMNYSIMV
jgi:hypothetical protein